MNPVKELSKYLPSMQEVLTGILDHLQQQTLLLEEIRDQKKSCSCNKEVGEITSETTKELE